MPPNNFRHSRCSQLPRILHQTNNGFWIEATISGENTAFKAPKCNDFQQPGSKHRLTVTYRSKDSLEVALVRSQDSLPPDQRDQFRAVGAPTITDDVSLTSEVGGKALSRKSRVLSRKIRVLAQGTRRILDSVQRHPTIVDVIVQSNPEFSALVWGSIKFVISVAGPESAIGT